MGFKHLENPLKEMDLYIDDDYIVTFTGEPICNLDKLEFSFDKFIYMENIEKQKLFKILSEHLFI